MEPLVSGFRQLSCSGKAVGRQLLQRTAVAAVHRQHGVRYLTTEPSTPMEENPELQAIKMPFQGVAHARRVPSTPSYFSRDPQFNDLYVHFTRLLAKYYHLPMVDPKEHVSRPWTKLVDLRAKYGEQIKLMHYNKVMRVARRLAKIEASVRPQEVDIALGEITRMHDPKVKSTKVLTIDRFGRAVGVGRRKESTARAFIVEGTGEILVNGKPLNEMFGRVHDRESATWALTSTQRLDKYNVWALVEGGGTTGQAEALTLAVAKGLLAHEPALKPTLRKAGCVTRDHRAVERKKHGRVKARKGPAWVKR